MKIAAGGFKKVIPYLTKISFEILKASSFLDLLNSRETSSCGENFES